MGAVRDLTGQRFGRLLIVKRSANKGNQIMWECRCDCGSITTVWSNSLKRGLTKSCGCYRKEVMRARTKDLTDRRFGRLLVTGRAYNGGRRVMWKCNCDCGKNHVLSGNSLTKTNCPTKSCGCLSREVAGARNFKDLTGRRFGRLIVLGFAGWRIRANGDRGSLWRCKCDCGNEKAIQGVLMLAGTTQSCGCYRQESIRKTRKDITGKRFGRLVAVRRVSNKGTAIMWQCRCDCGNMCIVHSNKMMRGHTRSCGCYAMSCHLTRWHPFLSPDDIPYELAKAQMDTAKIKHKLREMSIP